jgi:hypothetical protein
METFLDYLREFVRFSFEQWKWVLLIGALLLFRWFHGATSSQSRRGPSFARR